MKNWEGDPKMHEKCLVLDFVIYAFNKLARDEAPKISLHEITKTIDEWFDKKQKRSCGCYDYE